MKTFKALIFTTLAMMAGMAYTQGTQAASAIGQGDVNNERPVDQSATTEAQAAQDGACQTAVCKQFMSQGNFTDRKDDLIEVTGDSSSPAKGKGTTR